jgi:hypothetical protein
MRSRLPDMFLVMLPTYAARLDAPLPPRRKHWSRSKALKLRVRRLEGTLGIGNWLFESIRLIERNWRTEVLDQKTPYDPNEAQSIMDFYKQWAMPCHRCLEEIKSVESEGGLVHGAKRFRRYCEQAADIVLGDNPFFDDAETAGRWAALTAKHRKPCRPVVVDSDGRIFEADGERFNMPGLTPGEILEALEDERAGRMRSLKDIVASRNQHGI